jgi:hypothetical protein
MRKTPAMIVIAALALCATPARAADDSAVAVCNGIVDRAAEFLRAGQAWRARKLKPELERCGPILKAELERTTREIVRRHEDMVKRSKGQPI